MNVRGEWIEDWNECLDEDGLENCMGEREGMPSALNMQGDARHSCLMARDGFSINHWRPRHRVLMPRACAVIHRFTSQIPHGICLSRQCNWDACGIQGMGDETHVGRMMKSLLGPPLPRPPPAPTHSSQPSSASNSN